MRYRIGTRGSALAMAQTEWVIAGLRTAFPGDTFEIVRITTAGDRIGNVPLTEIGSRGVFVTEIEEALLRGEIDLAVHSMKDMPGKCAQGLIFSKAWQREDPRDVLVLREAASLKELPKNAVICTGSIRRSTQLLGLRADLKIAPIRGNIDTRLRKLNEPMENGKYPDGIILAAAGLNRLGLAERITQYLSPDEMIPAPAQGTLAVELRESDEELLFRLNSLSDEASENAARIERRFLLAAGGSCRLPVGAFAERDEAGWCLRAFFGNEDGSRTASVVIRSESPDVKIADEAAELLRSRLLR
ncbi:MAG: hydroxymethylbilane synthase [Eubacteriales bacterium]|nr:hydroxymethylbilane synthase [Eubacteriales bacterium]